MNNKHFIGENAKSFESLGLTDQIDGVLLKVDSGTAYRSGDQTGYVLEAECPYGTQAMADGLLAAVQGKSYAGFEAEGARLPVGAELGDGVTVRGLYGPLVRRRIRFGAELSADIGAPAGGDTDHEFGYTDPVERKIELAEARSRSYIDRRADEIRVGVVDEVDGKLAEIDVSLEGITQTVKGQGESLAALKLTADALSVDINGAEGSMGLKAAVEGLDFAVNDPDGAVNGKLAAKIGKDENEQIVSMLNASFDQINIKGNRFTLDSDNFKVAADGTVTMKGADVTGSVNAETFTLQGGSMEVKEENVAEYGGSAQSSVDVAPTITVQKVFSVNADIGVYTQKFYTPKISALHIGVHDMNFFSLNGGIIQVNAITAIRSIYEGSTALKDKYLMKTEGEWREITDGSGNKITVLCKVEQ